MSALMQVLGVMGNYAVTIGAAGTAFAATEVITTLFFFNFFFFFLC